MNAVSALIIAHDRDAHLTAVLNGLNEGTRRPEEVVVVLMDQPAHPQVPDGLNVRFLHIHRIDGYLPLAGARNMAADAAQHPLLLFLDVDCIPAPDAVERLASELERGRGLVMATPHYLPASVPPGADLAEYSRPHPARAHLQTGPSECFDMFWSLGFAVRKKDLERMGGFDEGYIGYGIEDTDFAYAARDEGLTLTFSDAVVHHQHHPTHSPPLQHVRTIVPNALRFRRKWGQWPVPGWLTPMQRMGLVSWTEDTLDVLREPGEEELAASLLTDRPF